MTDLQKAWAILGGDFLAGVDMPSDEVFVGYAVTWLLHRVEDCELRRLGSSYAVDAWAGEGKQAHGFIRENLAAALAALVLAFSEKETILHLLRERV